MEFKNKYLLSSVIFFMFGYIFKYVKVGTKGYLITQEELITIILVILVIGAAFPTLLQYPALKLKKAMIKKNGEVVAIEYIFSTGQVKLDVVNYAPQIDIEEGRFNLVKPSGSFMSMPLYRLYEGCNLSLDFNPADLEQQKEALAVKTEKETTIETPEGEYSIIPAPYTIAALSPLKLKQAYTLAKDFGLAQAQSKAEKTIKFTMLLSGIAALGGVIAAYLSYDLTNSLGGLYGRLNEALALIQAYTGAQQ